MPDPVVSPADTRRRDEAAMRMLAQSQVSHFGTGSGITGVPSCDRCGKPTNRWNEPCDYLPDTAHLLAEDVLALLAVGERDKAKMEQMHAHIAGLTDALELLRDSDSGERDRRQIAQLTEVGKAALIVADLNGEMRSTYGRVVTHAEWSTALCNLEMVAIAARAVLAGEEDAVNG